MKLGSALEVSQQSADSIALRCRFALVRAHSHKLLVLVLISLGLGLSLLIMLAAGWLVSLL